MNPTMKPTMNPSIKPTMKPTSKPTMKPTINPTLNPIKIYTRHPTVSQNKEPNSYSSRNQKYNDYPITITNHKYNKITSKPTSKPFRIRKNDGYNSNINWCCDGVKNRHGDTNHRCFLLQFNQCFIMEKLGTCKLNYNCNKKQKFN